MKIMKKILYILIVLVLVSCNKFVDVEPKGIATAETVKDLALMLNETLESGFANELMYSDEIAPVDQATYDGMIFEAWRRAYRFEDFMFTISENDGDWNNFYKVIATSNFILNRVDDLPDPNLQHDRVKGEALVHRAHAYFMLVNMYASNYTESTAGNDLGVPLLTEFGDPDIPLNRASVKEVYDLIIADYTEAVTLLPETANANTKPTKAAAYGLMAQAYLQMGNYDLALQNANQALALFSTLIDYNTLPKVPVAIHFDFVNLKLICVRPGEQFNPEMIFNSVTQQYIDIGPVLDGSVISLDPTIPLLVTDATSFVSDEVYALGDPIFDIRFANMILTRNGVKRFFGYANFIENGGLPRGISVPELILIKAESLARTGEFASAMTTLNDFRLTRYVSYAPPGSHKLIAASQEEAIQHVLDERQREFMYRGKRMFDIKRLNALHNAGISATHTLPDGTTVTLSPDDNKWNIAIPPKEISLSPELEQNPR